MAGDAKEMTVEPMGLFEEGVLPLKLRKCLLCDRNSLPGVAVLPLPRRIGFDLIPKVFLFAVFARQDGWIEQPIILARQRFSSVRSTIKITACHLGFLRAALGKLNE